MLRDTHSSPKALWNATGNTHLGKLLKASLNFEHRLLSAHDVVNNAIVTRLNRRHVAIPVRVLLDLAEGLERVVGNDAVQVGLMVHDLLGLSEGVDSQGHGGDDPLFIPDSSPSFIPDVKARQQHPHTWISISTAWPLAPPKGWWIIMRELGMLYLFPRFPAPRRNAPIEAARPKQ